MIKYTLSGDDATTVSLKYLYLIIIIIIINYYYLLLFTCFTIYCNRSTNAELYENIVVTEIYIIICI